MPNLSNNHLLSGFIFALSSATLFAIRPIFVKLVYEQGVDSTTLIAFRMLFSMPIYALLLCYFLRDKQLRARLNRHNILQIAGVGLLGYYIASFLDLIGLQYVTAQLGRMVLYCYPTFVVLLGALFFKQPITARTVVSLLLTYLGIAFIFGHDLQVFGEGIITGCLFIIGSALVFSVYLLFSKSLIQQTGSRVFTCIALISASFGIFVHFLLSRSVTQIDITPTALQLILFIAIFCTLIPSFFTTAAVHRIGADKTGIIAMLGPTFTSFFAVLILAEDFTIYHLIGIALTIIGIWILKAHKKTP